MSVSVQRRGSQQKGYWQRKVVQIQKQQKVSPELHRVATERLLSEASNNQSTEKLKPLPEQFRISEVRKKSVATGGGDPPLRLAPQEFQVLQQQEGPGNNEYFDVKKSPKEQQFIPKPNFNSKGPVQFNRNRGVAKRTTAQKPQTKLTPQIKPHLQSSEVFRMSMNPTITNAHNTHKNLNKKAPPVDLEIVDPETLVQRSTQKYSELRKLLQIMSGPGKTRSPRAVNNMKKMSIMHPEVTKLEREGQVKRGMVNVTPPKYDSNGSDGQSSIYMVEEEIHQTMSEKSAQIKNQRRNILMKKKSNILLRSKGGSPTFTNRIGTIKQKLGKRSTNTSVVSEEKHSQPETKRITEDDTVEVDEQKYLVGNKERFGQSFFKATPYQQNVVKRKPIKISNQQRPTIQQLQNPHFQDKPIAQVSITKNRSRQPHLMVMKSTRLFNDSTLSKISSKSYFNNRATSRTPHQISEGTDPIMCNNYEVDDDYIELEPKNISSNIMAGPVPIASSGYSTGESFHPSHAGTRQISPVPSQVVLNRNLVKQRRNKHLYLHSSFQSQKSTSSNDQLSRAMAIGRRILQIAPTGSMQRGSVGSILDNNDYSSGMERIQTQKSTYSGGKEINPQAKYNQLQNCRVKVNQENVNKKSLKFQQLQMEKLNQSQPIWLKERRCQSTISGAIVAQIRGSLPNIGSVSSRTHLHEKNSTVPTNKIVFPVPALGLFPIVKMQL